MPRLVWITCVAVCLNEPLWKRVGADFVWIESFRFIAIGCALLSLGPCFNFCYGDVQAKSELSIQAEFSLRLPLSLREIA